ncbi:MAG: helix-turn-helix domain-containing protein [Candidatus Heimdallarchaeota archaeon]|nr:helix-turn-helix domain-containing protein [Candidatus Heimdallarchaeota archaeon]
MTNRDEQHEDYSPSEDVGSGFSVSHEVSQRDSSIVELYDEGKSTYQIAEELELNRHTVSKVLKKNQIETRTIADYHKLKHEEVVKLFNKGKGKKEIAVILELTDYTVRKVLEERGLVFKKKDRDTILIARYIQMKNKGYDNESISIFLGITQKQLNKYIRNSGVNVTAVRHKTKTIENIADLIRKRLEGTRVTDLSLEYSLDLLLLREIFYDFGLCCDV